MNINMYKEYRLVNIVLKDESNQREFKISIAEDDRFYIHMEKHIISETINGLTNIPIDVLTILDGEQDFFASKKFTLSSILLVKDQNNDMHSHILEIKDIRIVDVDVMNKKNIAGNCVIKNCAIEIPYSTKKISISDELMD